MIYPPHICGRGYKGIRGSTMATAPQPARTGKIDVTDIQGVLTHLLVNGQGEVSDGVDLLLQQAAYHNASDVHFETFVGETTRVRFRVDGTFREAARLPIDLHDRIIGRIKVMGDMVAHEKMRPQDGRITLQVGRKMVDYRVNVIPTVSGEKAVVRIFNAKRTLLSLHQLGFDKETEADLAQVVDSLQGTVIISGPTGHGKTTTLYSLVQRVAKEQGNIASIITIEDPVEFNLGMFPQVQVNYKQQLDFATSLRAVLRQDPDVIMVGETRDPETAEIAMRAGLTGHLVLTSTHAGTAAEVLTRLLDMGVPPFVVASSVRVIVCQRLARRVCPECRARDNPTPEQIELIESTFPGEPYKFRIGAGCPKCGNTGFLGRTAITEKLLVNESVRKAILAGRGTSAIAEVGRQEAGLTPIGETALRKVKDGVCPIVEILRVLGGDMDLGLDLTRAAQPPRKAAS